MRTIHLDNTAAPSLDPGEFSEESITGEARTELDFLVIALRHMRQMRRDKNAKAAELYEESIIEYFRLPIEMQSSFVYDCLIELGETKAGKLERE